jgi:hypothetical protein
VSNFILRLLAIALCGGGGALIAWWLVSKLGGTGVGGGVASAMIGMVLAVLFWVGGVALIGTLKRDRQAKKFALPTGEDSADGARRAPHPDPTD